VTPDTYVLSLLLARPPETPRHCMRFCRISRSVLGSMVRARILRAVAVQNNLKAKA
jgi:hypothetical protein